MNIDNNNNKPDVVAMLRAEKKEMESDSREYGWGLGHEFFDGRHLGYSLIKKIVREKVEGRGYEPWANLHRILGEKLSHDVLDNIQNQEMNGQDFVYDQVAVGFFEAIDEAWGDVKKEVSQG